MFNVEVSSLKILLIFIELIYLSKSATCAIQQISLILFCKRISLKVLYFISSKKIF